MSDWPHWAVTIAVVVPTLLVSALAGWPTTALVLRSARIPEPPRVEVGREGRATVVSRRDEGRAPERTVLRGGRWIGLLERTALTAAILAGRFELAAVVVAVKALGRYPEIRENPGVSERFIIGTLTSLLVAGACGAVGATVLHALLH